MRFVLAFGLVALLGAPARAGDAAAAFEDFCREWMGKLAARQAANTQHIKWETNSHGVQGLYVGYSEEHSCSVQNGTGAVPVGKINYREVRYEKRGETVDAAERSTPQPVEITEVTEIFRYARGKWVY